MTWQIHWLSKLDHKTRQKSRGENVATIKTKAERKLRQDKYRLKYSICYRIVLWSYINNRQERLFIDFRTINNLMFNLIILLNVFSSESLDAVKRMFVRWSTTDILWVCRTYRNNIYYCSTSAWFIVIGEIRPAQTIVPNDLSDFNSTSTYVVRTSWLFDDIVLLKVNT